MMVLIPYINLLNLARIKKKMSIFEEHGAFNDESFKDTLTKDSFEQPGPGMNRVMWS